MSSTCLWVRMFFSIARSVPPSCAGATSESRELLFSLGTRNNWMGLHAGQASRIKTLDA